MVRRLCARIAATPPLLVRVPYRESRSILCKILIAPEDSRLPESFPDGKVGGSWNFCGIDVDTTAPTNRGARRYSILKSNALTETLQFPVQTNDDKWRALVNVPYTFLSNACPLIDFSVE